jgi:hypothetical protein
VDEELITVSQSHRYSVRRRNTSYSMELPRVLVVRSNSMRVGESGRRVEKGAEKGAMSENQSARPVLGIN